MSRMPIFTIHVEQIYLSVVFVHITCRGGIYAGGYGFYYSIAKNFYLCRNFYGGNSCTKEVLPGQKNLTEEDLLVHRAETLTVHLCIYIHL